MNMRPRTVLLQAGRAAMYPLWAAQLLSGAKSFIDNPLIGSASLNQRGLHVGRMALAHRMAAARRRRLAHLMSPADQADFDRDGFLLKPNFLADEHFAALLDQVQQYRGTARETVQGNAVTRRIALDPASLAHMPAVKQLLALPQWRGPIRYAGSFHAEPINYIQTILTHAKDGPDDPQCVLHSDTFHPTVKAWLFLTDVAADEGPFTYVPGSHRLTPQRRAWEHAMSLKMAHESERLTRRGSFRTRPDELAGLGLPQARAFPVRANTLVVADTHGFHARGRSAGPTRRVEIWAYGRRNPFLPWAGLDIWSVPALGQRRPAAFWQIGDWIEQVSGRRNTWQARPDTSAFDEA